MRYSYIDALFEGLDIPEAETINEDLKNPRSYDEIEAARSALMAKQAKIGIDMAKLDAEAAARQAQEASARVATSDAQAAPAEETVTDKVAEVEVAAEEAVPVEGVPVADAPATIEAAPIVDAPATEAPVDEATEEEVVEEGLEELKAEDVEVCEKCGKPCAECACKEVECKDGDCAEETTEDTTKKECLAEELTESYGYENSVTVRRVWDIDWGLAEGPAEVTDLEVPVYVEDDFSFGGTYKPMISVDYDAIYEAVAEALSDKYGAIPVSYQIDWTSDDEDKAYDDLYQDGYERLAGYED